MYLEYVPFFASAEGVIRGPAGDGRVGAVTRDDVADVAVTALLDPMHEGRTYEVTGREALTMAEAAELLTRFSGREVTYVEETIEEARASRAPSGAPDWEIEGWVTSYAAIATGELDVVTDTVARLAGHEPMTLAELLEAHPESWAHLRGNVNGGH
jgi:NAD(P)H dehydrogenase (quinone)